MVYPVDIVPTEEGTQGTVITRPDLFRIRSTLESPKYLSSWVYY